jgi:hypothetical protein
MINKTILLLFLPLFLSKTVNFSTLLSFDESVVELPQYGEVKVYGGSIVSLSLEGFKKDDNVYLEFSFDNGYYLKDDSLTIDYLESDEIVTKGSVKYLNSNGHSLVNTKYTLYFTIKLSGDFKYLVFGVPRIKDSYGSYITTYYTIRHTKSSAVTLIIVFVIIIVVIVVIAILFYCYRRKKRLDLAYQTGYQPQPAYQPAYQAPSAY